MGSREQSVNRHKEFTMGDFTAEMSPQYFAGIEPRTIGWQVKQHQPPGGSPDDHFDLVVLVRAGIVSGDKDRVSGILINKGLK